MERERNLAIEYGCDLSTRQESKPPISRRALLRATGVLSAAALAGCTGTATDDELPKPVSLAGGKQCVACGMVIEEQPGPSAMAFYREDPDGAGDSDGNGDSDGDPDGDDELGGDGDPAWFDTVFEMAAYDAEKRRNGRERVVAYVTDYSTVEYEITREDGEQYVSSHVSPGSFVAATDAYYVVHSEVNGAMGADFLPFSRAADATTFRDEHGGAVVPFDNLPDSP